MGENWTEKYKDKMLKLTKTTLRDGRERQFSVCKTTSGFYLTRPCVGTRCYVKARRDCVGKTVGDFHTHPGAPPSPSHFDFFRAYKDGFKTFCIGSGNASDAPPKVTMVDGKKVTTHTIGWSREGVPEVDCFRMAEKPTIDAWMRKHKLEGGSGKVKGRWTIKKYLSTDFAKKLEKVFYDNAWFGQEPEYRLYTHLRTFKGRL